MDVQCFCTNSALVSMIGACVLQSCPADVQQEAIQFFDSECAPFTATSIPSLTTSTSTSGKCFLPSSFFFGWERSGVHVRARSAVGGTRTISAGGEFAVVLAWMRWRI